MYKFQISLVFNDGLSFNLFSQKISRQLLHVMIFFGVCTVLTIVGLINFSVSAVFNVVWNAYQFIIVYSLWRKFQEKEMEKEEAAVQPQISVIVDENNI